MKTTVRTQIFIAATPEAITEVVLDPTKAVLWTSDLESFEVLSGSPGQAGSIARLHYGQGGNRYVMEDRLLEAEAHRRYLSRVSGDALTAEVETSLEPSPAGTMVAVRWTGSGRSPIFRLILPFMRGAIARQAQADLVKLKNLVERDNEMGGLTTRWSPSRVLRDRPGQPAAWFWRNTSLGLAVRRRRGVCGQSSQRDRRAGPGQRRLFVQDIAPLGAGPHGPMVLSYRRSCRSRLRPRS
jgi:hypothetical protein